jgi:hypothetical protein
MDRHPVSGLAGGEVPLAPWYAVETEHMEMKPREERDFWAIWFGAGFVLGMCVTGLLEMIFR